MKRFWTALAAAFVLSLALVACGGASADYKENFIGTWEVTSLTQNGEETSAEQLETMKSYGLAVYLDLNEDGTSALDLFGETREGTWEAKSADKVTVTINDDPIEGTLGDGILTLSQDGSELVLKQIDPSERIDTSEAASALAPSNGSTYYGGDTIEDLDGAVTLDIPLVDDEQVAIKVLGMGSYVGDPGFLLELTNKTASDVLFVSGNGWNTNGIATDPVLYETVKAGETLGSILWFNASEVGSDVTTLADISGLIDVYDSADTSVLINSYPVSF